MDTASQTTLVYARGISAAMILRTLQSRSPILLVRAVSALVHCVGSDWPAPHGVGLQQAASLTATDRGQIFAAPLFSYSQGMHHRWARSKPTVGISAPFLASRWVFSVEVSDRRNSTLSLLFRWGFTCFL